MRWTSSISKICRRPIARICCKSCATWSAQARATTKNAARVSLRSTRPTGRRKPDGKFAAGAAIGVKSGRSGDCPGNAALIVGRRALTRGIQLDGRVFLHSYDYRGDPEGKLLEAVMTGPQIVAQWINMEHYFSTVDQEVYGSGSKIYHNVVGRLGIMSGPQSDLRTGLAWQTVMNGQRPYHEAMRLFTLIEAPRDTNRQDRPKPASLAATL